MRGIETVLLRDEDEDSPPSHVWHLTAIEGGGLGRMAITIDCCAYTETSDSRAMDTVATVVLDPEELVDALNLLSGRKAFTWHEPEDQ